MLLNKTSILPPLLIPQVRYGKEQTHHKYRVDFIIIDPYSLNKIGFELSPRSTHGIKNIHEKTKEEIKTEAQDQQDHEFQKRNSYIMEYNIPIITFYGDDFKSTKDIFEVIKKFLEPTREYKDQLLFEHVEERFLVNDIEITAS